MRRDRFLAGKLTPTEMVGLFGFRGGSLFRRKIWSGGTYALTQTTFQLRQITVGWAMIEQSGEAIPNSMLVSKSKGEAAFLEEWEYQFE